MAVSTQEVGKVELEVHTCGGLACPSLPGKPRREALTVLALSAAAQSLDVRLHRSLFPIHWVAEVDPSAEVAVPHGLNPGWDAGFCCESAVGPSGGAPGRGRAAIGT